MMKHIYIILIGLVITFGSCNDYEDVPVENYTLEYVFSRTDSLGKHAKAYLGNIYMVMPNGHSRVADDYLDAATDDAITSSLTQSPVYSLSIGRYGPSVVVPEDMYWGKFYTGIRQANTFINNIDVVPLKEKFSNHAGTDITLNRAWKAEAKFLKAFFYFELVKRYGGVPLVGDMPYELNADIELPRNSFEECINYIVGELDAVQDSLRAVPIANSGQDGHVVTTGAALALKSRVLLYAASPLFNGKTLDSTNPLVGYTDYKADRWKDAAATAKKFIDAYGHNGANLYNLNSDFRDVFLRDWSPSENEVIFFVQGENDSKKAETNNGPIGFSGNALGKGRTSPTQNLVDAFPMKNGKTIKEDGSGYNAKNMYDNRDPRMEYTVLHNRSRWLSTSLETFEGGKSNPSGSTLQKTKTSYYMRKFMGKFEEETEYKGVIRVWVLFRYAEMLLNYAEAQNEYEYSRGASSKPSTEIYDAIIKIRERAGIDAGADGMYGLDANMNCEQMRTIIQNERRIELAFEEQRYWDIRRWRTAEQIFEKPLTGLAIVQKAGILEYNEIEVLKTNFDKKRNLYPIPYSEVIKNSRMVQNPEW